VKNRIFIIAIVLSAVLYWSTGWSIENPGISNPIGSSTIPPSTNNKSLMNSPSPVDMDGNLLITGNVRRGRHFRGDVPYRSPTNFGSSLGSSSLSSFLRDTAGPEDFQTYSNKYGSQPYYSPTETVTTMMPGRSGIFMPESTRLSTRAQQDTRSEASGVFGLDSTAKEQILFSQGTIVADSGSQRPASQYGPLAQSKLMLESRFPTSTSQAHQGTEFATAQIDIHGQAQTSSIGLLREQVQDVVDRTQNSTMVPNPGIRDGRGERNESFRFPNQEMNNESLRPKFNTQTSGQNQEVDRKRNALNHQDNFPLEQFTGIPFSEKTGKWESTPSMDSVSQEKNFLLQKGTNWSDTSREFQTEREQTSAAALERTKGTTSGSAVTEQDWDQGDVLERIRQQLEDLTKSLDASMQSQRLHTERHDEYKDVSTDQVAKRRETPLGYQSYIPDSSQVVPRERINSNNALNYYRPQGTEIGFKGEDLASTARRGLNRTDAGMRTGLDFTEIPDYKNYQKKSSPLDELERLSQAEISAEASRIMGSHNSIESLSQSKFNQYMRDAEEHLKAGRYYRAASCFSLASVYQPDNPLALAGRGHALFAAGEYVSSALFLSRALAINPEYLQVKVDLVAILGDERKLAGRIVDIEKWLSCSGSSQLQFLLGYVYYRTGQFGRAKQAIDTAYTNTPQSPAVQAMKITLDNMMMQR
jgi:tetratricopeptide (TPR) repeat protein